jgi:hypothetical protein
MKKNWSYKQNFFGFKFLFLVLFLSVLFPGNVFGQGVATSRGLGGSAGNGGYEPNLYIDLTPQSPGALQTVNINLRSYGVDVHSDNIMWYVDGSLREQGKGDFTFKVKTGSIGTKTVLKVVVTDPTYGNVSKTITINPGSIDILWQADTYTPPFYRGKALPTSQSDITFVAIPHTKSYSQNESPKNLTYTWYQSYNKVPDVSGYGKESASLTANYAGNNTDIKVDVSDPASGTTFSGQISVKIVNPLIVFYPQNDQLGTLYQSAMVTNPTINQQSLGVVAEPYFFSFNDINNNNAIYSWSVNNKKVATNNNKSQILLKFPSKGSGKATVGLHIEDPSIKYILQRADNSFSLTF